MTHIHPEASLAEGVQIEPFTTIQKNVTVGEGTWIGPNVTIFEGAHIGKNCKIFPGAVISGVPQDLKYKGEKTETFIGDNTVIRECVTISKGTDDRMKTVIGSNCLLMAYVHVAHDCIIGDHSILANSVQVAGHVVIGDHVVIGGTTAIHQFARIGDHSMVGGGSLVRKDVPPFVKAAREPLAYCGLNTIGLRRRGFSNDQISELQELYRIIYSGEQTISNAIKKIEAEITPSEYSATLLEFMKTADRGIIKG